MRRLRPLFRNVLVLLFLALIMALITAWRFSKDNLSARESYSQVINHPSGDEWMVLKDMPEPGGFKYFEYRGEDFLSVELKCLEDYATVLIYDKETDYRFDPLGAKFNTAFPCVQEDQLTELLNLRSANLEIGLEYYLIKAHQGKDGIWHKPY